MPRLSSALLLLLLLMPHRAAAQESLLSGLYSDHMVVQRGTEVFVQGIGAPGSVVTVSLGDVGEMAKVDDSGSWRTMLPPLEGGGPFVLRAEAADGTVQEVKDVMVGDVYLCTGQSNMVWPVSRSDFGALQARQAADAAIRMLTIPNVSSHQPQDQFDAPQHWEVASPETVPDWSAACYFFARDLRRDGVVDAPIGLITAAWGGSGINSWLDAEAGRELGFEEELSTLSSYGSDESAAQARFGADWEDWWLGTTGMVAENAPWLPETGRSWPLAPLELGDWTQWDGLAGFTGMIWFRAVVELSADQARQGGELHLGAADEVDQTWINGDVVGNTFGYGTERVYRLPDGILREGQNVLVTNVLNTWAAGGLTGDHRLRGVRLADGTHIPFEEWRYSPVRPPVGGPPRAPWEAVGGLTTIHNGMTAPLGPIGLRGVLWYQGESDPDNGPDYGRRLKALKRHWRRQFRAPEGTLPALIVQLPNFGASPTGPYDSGWGHVRDGQRRATEQDENAALVVILDAGDPNDIHPTDKLTVGERLAMAGKVVVYGQDGPAGGPLPVRATRSGNEVRVTFSGDALRVYGSAGPVGFELCGPTQATCRYAHASATKNEVHVSIGDDLPVTRVRYAWSDNPTINLFGVSGVPVTTFELHIRPGVTQPPSTQEDHRLMMNRLGVDALRPGSNGLDTTAANYANYDESQANPYPSLPDPLLTMGRERVATPGNWWERRRPELVELFERELYGRIPTNIPDVSWRSVGQSDTTIAGVRMTVTDLVGDVAHPSDDTLSVSIDVQMVLPMDADGPVPVVLQFGFPRWRFGPASTPTWQEQVAARGWGYAIMNPYSVQGDRGEDLYRGIIGLANGASPRSPDEWGALRAWAWGASRLLDHFESLPAVAHDRVALQGHSRFGKAVLVAMAFDQRFAAVFVSSSGQGGAKLHRRNWGEIVENVAGSGEYHWMAGNYLKYAGPLTWDDLPVDAHELIALCAPRPVFISSGDVGDYWVDARGMFMAAKAASPVYELLGEPGLGADAFPPVGHGLMSGTLSYRQHPEGHVAGPNWPVFLEWASRWLER